MPKEDDYKSEISFVIKQLARSLNHGQAALEKLDYVFEMNRDWNTEVKYTIEEGLMRIGLALGCLETWDEEDPA